jgi:hypothetical protein
LLTGQSGNTDVINLTIPKSAVQYESTPTVYVGNQITQDQGYKQDADNYYVWYTTHFSTHQVSIVFIVQTSKSELSLEPIPYFLVIILLAAIIVAVIKEKRK